MIVSNVDLNIIISYLPNHVLKSVEMEKDSHFNAMMEITKMEMVAVQIVKYNHNTLVMEEVQTVKIHAQNINQK